jgi:SAM-dependent methyltransferase
VTDADDNRHFGAIAENYRTIRPAYPDALFDFLAACVDRHDLAWDCGTGSGQSAAALAKRFRRVRATDSDPRQLAAAIPAPNIHYALLPAETDAGLDGVVDLITCACAVHWFDLDHFYAQARRALRPGGVIAVWTYDWPWTGAPAVDSILRRLKDDVLGPWWGPESAHYFGRYENLPFPFAELPCPTFTVAIARTPDELLNFVGTWSAVTRYRARLGQDPLAVVREELAIAWRAQPPALPLRVPLHLRAGRRADAAS